MVISLENAGFWFSFGLSVLTNAMAWTFYIAAIWLAYRKGFLKI